MLIQYSTGKELCRSPSWTLDNISIISKRASTLSFSFRTSWLHHTTSCCGLKGFEASLKWNNGFLNHAWGTEVLYRRDEADPCPRPHFLLIVNYVLSPFMRTCLTFQHYGSLFKCQSGFSVSDEKQYSHRAIEHPIICLCIFIFQTLPIFKFLFLLF